MAQVRNEALRTQLLECAIRHFSSRGYVAANMLEIAEEVGVTRGPLYYYFSSKAELYLAAAEYATSEMKKNYERILVAEHPVRSVLREDFAYCLQNRDNFFSSFQTGRGIPDISGIWNAFSQWLLSRKHEVFAAAKARGELREDCNIAELITFIYVFYHGVNHTAALSARLDGFSGSMLSDPTEFFMRIVAERYLA